MTIDSIGGVFARGRIKIDLHNKKLYNNSIMRFSIGEQLGAMAAQFERDLSDDPDDIQAMQKMALVSESFRNFSLGGLEGFKEQFDLGYENVVTGQRELERLEQAELEHKRGEQDKGSTPGLGTGPK